jgi:micrococcal nuclease
MMFKWLLGRGQQSAEPIGPQVVSHELINVSDADTIWVGEEKFRLVDFDAPETAHAKTRHEWQIGQAATDRLEALLAPPAAVTLLRVPGHETFDRGLARLFVNGRNVAEIAIEEGWGVPYDGRRRKSKEKPDWSKWKYPRP